MRSINAQLIFKVLSYLQNDSANDILKNLTMKICRTKLKEEAERELQISFAQLLHRTSQTLKNLVLSL